MRPKAINDLAQFTDSDLFSVVAEGLTSVHENATRIEDAARIVNEKRNIRSARILDSIAKEEAAKYLILLDAIRCPRKPEDRFSKHLSKFNLHLAKGLYAEACSWHPREFGEIKGLIQSLSDKYYLDGPTGYDWIFRNPIISEREEAFYVDYVEYNDGEHAWLSPKVYEHISLAAPLPRRTPDAVELVDHLHRVGFSNPDSLSIVAQLWRPVSITDATTFRDVRALIHRNLEKLACPDLLATFGTLIEERWPFPLYGLEMCEIPVKTSELKEIQETWSPEI